MLLPEASCFEGHGKIVVMSRRRQFIIGLAVFGLAITAFIYASATFIPDSEPPSRTEIFLGVLSIILCPPSLLSVALFDIDAYTIPGAILWLIIGLINSGLYAAVGVVISIFRLKTDKELPESSEGSGSGR